MNRNTVILSTMALAFTALIAAAVLFRSPYSASGLDIVPDSVEYAIGAQRIASQGSYDILLNGQSYHPRYPPWFSLFILAPAYVVFGDEIGNGIISVLVLGICGVLGAFLIGRKAAGINGGVLASLALLTLPLYRTYGKEIMTEVPCSALIILLCLAFVHMRRLPDPGKMLFGLAGMGIALTAALRPLAATVGIPFLILLAAPQRHRILKTSCLILPVCVIAVLNALYNYQAFGSPFRSGYQFWCPIPCDYFSLSFSPAYVAGNFKAMTISGIFIAAGLAALLFVLARALTRKYGRADHSGFDVAKNVSIFAILGTGPFLLLHLFFFFADPRFFLPPLSLVAIVAGLLLAVTFSQSWNWPIIILQALILIGAFLFRAREPLQQPIRRLAVQQLQTYAPRNAVVISAIDPVYLEFMLGPDSQRTIIPLSRNVEYASKLVAPARIRLSSPLPEWRDHRHPELREKGALDVVPATADEMLPSLSMQVSNKPPVFLVNAWLTEQDFPALRAIEAQFVFKTRDLYLFELAPQVKTSTNSDTNAVPKENN